MMDIQETLTRIGEKEGIDCVLGVRIARNNVNLKQMTDPVREENRKLLEKYGEHDKNGKLIINNNGSIPLKDDKAFNEESKRLMNDSGEVELSTFTMEELKQMYPTPNQIMLLLPIIK
jgi:hypothetical protein